VCIISEDHWPEERKQTNTILIKIQTY